MTPISSTRSSALPLPLPLPEQPPTLATQALSFNAQRQCLNKHVMAEVINALSNKSSSDPLIAIIFNNAYRHGYMTELNQFIKNLQKWHGPDVVLINRNVVQLLADLGIELTQNADGTVLTSKPVTGLPDPLRREAIRLATEPLLPYPLNRIIGAYDDDIAVNEGNISEIFNILRSGHPTEKSLVIAAASRQVKIGLLDNVFDKFRAMRWEIDLSHVDLSNLDLSFIQLDYANLSHANLCNSKLGYANLRHARLVHANLNNTRLILAKLNSADLSNARLIAADLFKADLRAARLHSTTLLCANLNSAEFDSETSLHEQGSIRTAFNYSSLHLAKFAASRFRFVPLINELDNDCTAGVICSDPDETPAVMSTGTLHPAVNVMIHDHEKSILLANQVEINDHGNGTLGLTRSVATLADAGRRKALSATLESLQFPTTLHNLIAGYDDEIDISSMNRKAILDILKSSDQSAKSLLMGCVSRQKKVETLNELCMGITSTLNFSDVDCRSLNLTGISLPGANFTRANFQHSCLDGAFLINCNFTGANLNGASLVRIKMGNTILHHARLIGANLFQANLNHVGLIHTCFLAANLQEATVHYMSVLYNTHFQFANLKNVEPAIQFVPHDGPVNAIIVSELPTPDDTQPTQRTRDKPLVITEQEKGILLGAKVACKVACIDNGDGTVTLSLAATVYKNPERHQQIKTTLTSVLPDVLTDLISAYDDEIDLCEHNEAFLLSVLRSSDQQAKAQIIAAASHQNKIRFLNTLFEKFREHTGQLNLSNVDLSNLDLRGINLYDTKLNGANMHGCDLLQANLRGAQMIGANLNGAFLHDADLSYADLSDARLIKAKLTNARLMQVNLSRAVLKFANLDGAELTPDANLSHAWLDHAILAGTNLQRANLTGASFAHAIMRDVQLDRSDLSNASLVHAELSKTSMLTVNLTHADFSYATLDRVTFIAPSIFKEAIWTGASFNQIRSDPETMKQMPLRMWMHSTAV